MKHQTLSPAALAASMLLVATSAAQEKIPSVPAPSFDVDSAPARPLADDATRSPIRTSGADAALGQAAIAPRADAPRGTAVVAPPLTFPLHDVAADGTQWVRGRTYKASFGTDGATYVPQLGRRAPRNFPVAFDVGSVTVGGDAIAFERAAPATRAGSLVSFERGSFVEQYVIAAESIEQRFVFDALPSRGEVVVSIDVTSELAGRGDAGGGFRFENDLGGMSYGRAFALDASGAKIGIESRLAAGRIELVVPASFVATAQLPLVIDPYAGTFAVDTDSGSDWQADVAYDASTNSFAVVYENIYSDTDHDVYIRKYVDQVFQDVATIDFTTEDWRNPKVANNNISNQFFVVAQAGPVGVRVIKGRPVSASAFTVGTSVTISGSEVGDKLNPDIGGDPASTAPTYYCVVWQRLDSGGDNDIHARIVTASSTFPGTTIFLANSTTLDDEFPSISKTNGKPPFSTQEWNVVWQHATNDTNDDIQGARILWDGTVTETPFFVASTTENERAPTAAPCLDDTGIGRPWLAAYTITGDVRLRVFSNTTALATDDLLGSSFNTLGQPTLATDGRKWPFAHTSSFGLFPNIDVDLHGGTLNYVNGQLSYAESLVLASSDTVSETRPEIASTHTATLTNEWRNYVVYDGYNGADYDVRAVVYDAPVNAGGYLYCNGDSIACPCANGNNGFYTIAGCANSVTQTGAQLDVLGQWAWSADSATLRARGLPATTTCLFFQGANPVTTTSFFGDGARCVGGSIVRLGTKTASNGVAAYGYPADVAIHTRGLIPASGGWRYYQAWYRNAAAFCTTSTFNLSNGAALLWAP